MKSQLQKTGNSYYGKAADNYKKNREFDKTFATEQLLMKGLLRNIANNSKVLDVPFGTGRFVDFYLDKKFDIYGLEISRDMISAAKCALGESFAKCTVVEADATQKFPFDDDFFDLVVSFRFLKFFSYNTAKEILQEIHRVTKSDVLLRMVIRTDNEPDDYLSQEYLETLDNIKGNLYEKDLRKLLRETGFVVENAIRVEQNINKMPPKISHPSLTQRMLKNIRNGSVLKVLKKKMRHKNKRLERVIYHLRCENARQGKE